MTKFWEICAEIEKVRVNLLRVVIVWVENCFLSLTGGVTVHETGLIFYNFNAVNISDCVCGIDCLSGLIGGVTVHGTGQIICSSTGLNLTGWYIGGGLVWPDQAAEIYNPVSFETPAISHGIGGLVTVR